MMEEEVLEQEIVVENENYVASADLSNYYTKDETDTLLQEKENVLTFDTTPTLNSNNPVTSNGIAVALENAGGDLNIVEISLQDSSAVIKEKIQGWYDDYLENKAMYFILLKGLNVTEVENAIATFTAMNIENGNGYFRFEAQIIPYYENYNGTYGVIFKPVYRYYLQANVTNNIVTSCNLNDETMAFIPLYENDFLGVYNNTYYEPYNDYSPSTKKYVDDLVGDINTVLATLTTINDGSDN